MKQAAPRLPFQGLGLAEWTNLAMAALATLFLGFVAWAIALFGVLDVLIGTDFRGFYASGQIAASNGFAAVYDPAVQEQFQRPLTQAYSRLSEQPPYLTIPVPYLPPFIVPFMILPYLGPLGGFLAWTLASLAGMALYLRRFVTAIGCRIDARLWPALLLASPVLPNLFGGQVSLWLLICTGEAFLAALRGRDLRSGLWLAGLMIKPQILILILPGLLIGRRWRALAGFGMAASALLLASVGLAGVQGMAGWLTLVTAYTDNFVSASPQHMANWRSLAINLGPFLTPALSYAIAVAGVLLTAGAALALWVPAIGSSPSRLALVWTATFAATCAATWHSHVHMAMPLIALLLYLSLKGILPAGRLVLWLLAPSLVGAAFSVVAAAALLWFGMATVDLGPRLAGLTLLALNLGVLAWARLALKAPSPATAARVLSARAPARTAADALD